MTSTERPEHAEMARSTWTREAWLESAVEAFRPRFEEFGAPLPERVHVSVGFAKGARAESKTILGQCWKGAASDDGVNHIFISPEIGDTAVVLETLLHELVHAADDTANPLKRLDHKGLFAELATRLGFLGPMDETPSSAALAAELMLIAETLGDYPHGKLNASRKPVKTESPAAVGTGGVIVLSSGPKPQTNRYFVARCPKPECEGWGGRFTRKHLERAMPICGICGERMPLA